MRIENIDFGFLQIIEKSGVEKIVCKYDGICTVYFYDRPPLQLNIGCSSFNAQYGIPISEDGGKLFVGSWEMGLCAYDIMSGRLLWKFRSGRIRNILVYPNFLIVSRAHSSVVKVDIKTGKQLSEIRSGTLERIFKLDASFVFADTMSGKHSIIDIENMRVVKRYLSKTINPNNCLSLMIRDVVLQENVVTIIGLEEYPRKNFEQRTIVRSRPFSRIIDENFCRTGDG